MEFIANHLLGFLIISIPRIFNAAVFLTALYFVIKKAVKDANNESNRPKF
ncbi:hypothetical protein [Agathobaculum sp. TL06]